MVYRLKVQISDSPMTQSHYMRYNPQLRTIRMLMTYNYAEQPKFINEGKVDQDAEQCLENKTTESLNQTLVSENDCLKKTIAKLQPGFFKTRGNKRIAFENSIQHKKEDSSPSSTNELEKESGENICDNAKCEFQTKFVELEKVLTQQTKDFDDVKLELSNITAKFEAYFEKLEKTKVVLERQLARKVDDSKAEKDQFLKEINHLRTQLENLKGKSVKTKFDKSLILGEPPAEKLWITSQLSKSWFTPKISLIGKIVTNRFTLIVLSALRRSDIENRQEILLKMNLPDHRLVLTDPKDQVKIAMETPHSSGVNSPPNAHT
ncbi:hypothetical protein Tco_0839373 [Tanacetum coccineum]|uniref:Uncharacterized protein n=1 Tax=Tanacetum coccineum TaxID=301880 RepID=A0ABQ5AQE3_9ASTR